MLLPVSLSFPGTENWIVLRSYQNTPHISHHHHCACGKGMKELTLKQMFTATHSVPEASWACRAKSQSLGEG